MLGMYLLLADDTVENYTSTDAWEPELYQYQKDGAANVFYLTFINPSNMAVPPSFTSFTKNANVNGATVMFAVGGYSYSMHPNPWPFLESVEAAEAMAAQVAQWPSKHGCDGIDLDIETGAGAAPHVGENLAAFVKKLNELNPSMLVTQPVFGFPQVQAESDMVNAAFGSGADKPRVDAVGIMVYSGTGALQYVKNYAHGTQQWKGFPIHADVPTESIVAGAGGNAAAGDLEKFVAATKGNDGIRGIMVWYASVLDKSTGKAAVQYAHGAPDASNKKTTGIWAPALKEMLAGQ
jgi:hypothetical protein